MAKLLDFYLKDKLLTECYKYFDSNINNSIGYLNDEDHKLISKEVDNLFKFMDDIFAENKDLNDAYEKIIDQLCGYVILGKMNEAILCNVINDMINEKD